MTSGAGSTIPTIDVGPFLDADSSASRQAAAQRIDDACRDTGFFGIVGHGLDELQERLEDEAHAFFDQPNTTKSEIAMARAGSAWRGWFPVGGELTSGRPDRKEGIYFGDEHAPDHPLVVNATPLHGPNQFPATPPGLRGPVLDWLDALRPVADAVMRAMALGLGLQAEWFERELTAEPTVLFRIFHYPPGEPGNTDDWGVGEHTDYGLLTLLAQDRHGGLQVRGTTGSWIDVPAEPGVVICNLGDMLERLTGGRYRSTPHRVRNTSGHSRLSFPYFFDPSWTATVPTLPLDGAGPPPDAERWDGADVLAWSGTYGEYLTAKVSRVFPELFADVSPKPQ